MRGLISLLLTLSSLLSTHAWSSAGTCEKECDCGKNLAKRYLGESGEIIAPSKLPITRVCNYRWSEDRSYLNASFLFSGSVEVNGIIRRYESDSLGDQAEFHVDTDNPELVVQPTYLLKNLRLANDAFRKFRIPKLTEKTRCWSAAARIRIRKIESDRDAGTDFSGDYLLDYDVIRVGKFSRCG